ncbi:MAG: hypothetical protein Q8P03_00665 [bacterium]|nr:hypothetical protein [bacterium]
MAFSIPKSKTLVQQRQMQRLLVFLMFGVIGITAFVLYQGFLKPLPEAPGASFAPSGTRSVDINFEFLKSSPFEKFSEPLPQPSAPLNLGRQNPFLPL